MSCVLHSQPLLFLYSPLCSVYQYIFRYGDPGERWIMMWDYNIGLVRITHLFKALGYTKVCSPGLSSHERHSHVQSIIRLASNLNTDNPGQSPRSKPRTPRHLSQHNRRSNRSPR
jgi:hypothetical protein